MTIKTKVTSDLDATFKAMLEMPQKVAKEAHKYFVSITPKRTGNARRNTLLKDTTILANYEYASNLDEGASKKAPDGMSEPTMQRLQGLVDKEIKKIR